MAIPNLPTGLVINGNPTTSGNEKIILSTVEAQVKRVLTNELAMLATYATMTAESINVISNAGMAVYTLPERMVWGNDYDPITGAEQQTLSARRFTVLIDQKITIKFDIEDFDIERFIESPVAVKTGLVAGWVSSITMNYDQNIDAFFLRGIIDFIIASGQFFINPKITNRKTAEDAFYYYYDKLINTGLKAVSSTHFGTNKSDWVFISGMNNTKNLTKAYTQIYGSNISAETLKNGNLYGEQILGAKTAENFYLETSFIKGKNTGINKDTDFNFTNWPMLMIHRDAIAMPLGFKAIIQIINPNTQNIRWSGKALYAKPTMGRPQLVYGFYTTAPTSEEVTAAQANKGITFDVPPWIEFSAPTPPALSTVITNLELGNIDTGGSVPTDSELDTAVIALNPKYTAGYGAYSVKTITGATLTGDGTHFSGSVDLTFTVS